MAWPPRLAFGLGGLFGKRPKSAFCEGQASDAV